MGVGEVAQAGQLDGHRGCSGGQEAVHQLRGPSLWRRRPGASGHQLRRHLHHLSTEHTQHTERKREREAKKLPSRLPGLGVKGRRIDWE